MISAEPVKPRTLYLSYIPPRNGDFDLEDGVLWRRDGVLLRRDGVLLRRVGEVPCFRGDLLGGGDLLGSAPFASSFDSSMSSKFPITFGPGS